MTTTTIQASTTNYGMLESTGSTYAAARSGPAASIDNVQTFIDVGQFKISSSSFEVDQVLLEFDTSTIPVGAVLSSVSLQIWGITDHSAQDFIVEARLYDYGSSVALSDYVGGTGLSALPRLATFDTSAGWSITGFNAFTEDGTNFQDNLVLGGVTRILLDSQRTVTGTTPGANAESVAFVKPNDATTAHRPQLVVTYTTITTSTRTLSSTSWLANRFTRTVNSTTYLIGSATRTLSSTSRLRSTLTRTLSSTSRLANRLTRSLSSTSRLMRTLTRTVSSTARLAQQVTRSVSSTTRLLTSLTRTVSSTSTFKVVPTRTASRAGALLSPTVTLRLHTPLPGAISLTESGLPFLIGKTSLVINTSIEHGFESCQIGFPQRMGDIVLPAWLPEPVMAYRPYGHTTVADAGALLFLGRMNQQPQYLGLDIMAVTAQGYADAPNDLEYTSTDDTLTSTGVIIEDILAQITPYIRIDHNNWADPNVSHAKSEYNKQRGAAAIADLLGEGSATGALYDLQFWSDQQGHVVARLVARIPPALVDYECVPVKNTNIFNIAPDLSQLYSHVAVTYTPPGGTETTTPWQPALTDHTFRDRFGFERTITLPAGSKTESGALQYRDTMQTLYSQEQWGGTIKASAQYPIFHARSNIPAPLRFVRAGQWLRVRGMPDRMFLILKTSWDAGADTLQMTVSQGAPRESLQDQMTKTLSRIRAARNPISGAPAT